MRKIFPPVLFAMLVLLLLSACSNTPRKEVPIEEKLANLGYVMGPQVKRINDFQINGWNTVDRKNAILFVGPNRRYLVTTKTPCDGLEGAVHLGYSTTVGSLTDKDKLLVRRTQGYVDSCFIDTLVELEKIK